ncbi:hypothetical protein A2U01_0073441 [Trifolium medium]|uniref:Uncharacterized protein n=1 Tax=Trifolium medium TaxID=97028 RepID=A0A392SUT7_9FABA|nr:hypothetical protein [Trifolium medium]
MLAGREKAKESDGHSESSSLQRQKATGNQSFLAPARESDMKLQETENFWLERKKATSAMLAHWHGRWVSKP